MYKGLKLHSENTAVFAAPQKCCQIRGSLFHTMKQKIIIQVPMHCDKCRSKAMQIAVAMEGVTSVNIEWENNQLVIIGDGVDSASLTTSLRKKFSYAEIVVVEQVPTEKVQEENTNQDDKPEGQQKDQVELQTAVEGPCYGYPHHEHYYICHTIYDPPPTTCSIV